jgi:hypothetical protein
MGAILSLDETIRDGAPAGRCRRPTRHPRSSSVDSKPVGEILITGEHEQEFHISLPAEIQSRIAPTHGIDVTLRSELTWTGADVHINDNRELSLALYAIGFLQSTEGTPESAGTCSERFSKKEAVR